jgi:hypothetical protein
MLKKRLARAWTVVAIVAGIAGVGVGVAGVVGRHGERDVQ